MVPPFCCILWLRQVFCFWPALDLEDLEIGEVSIDDPVQAGQDFGVGVLGHVA